MKLLFVILIIAVIIAVVAFYGPRIRRAFVNTVPLHDVTDQFPKEYTVGDPSNPVLNYVALGDSTAYGVGASTLEHTYPYGIATVLAERGYFVHVRNTGRSGARLEEVVNTQFGLVPEQTDVLSISIGGNDATHLTNAANYRSLIGQLTTKLTVSGIPAIMIASTTDMALTPSIPPVANTVVGIWVERQNREMQPAVEGIGASYVNLFKDGKLDKPELYASDEFHPGDLGYAKWAPLFREATLSQLTKIPKK